PFTPDSSRVRDRFEWGSSSIDARRARCARHAPPVTAPPYVRALLGDRRAQFCLAPPLLRAPLSLSDRLGDLRGLAAAGLRALPRGALGEPAPRLWGRGLVRDGARVPRAAFDRALRERRHSRLPRGRPGGRPPSASARQPARAGRHDPPRPAPFGGRP